MWPLTQNVPYERMQGIRTYGKRMDEKWIAKPFAMERLNGWTDDENVWMDEVERINGWRKFLNGCSRTDEENFWTDEVERMNGWRKILSDWLWCAEYFSFRWVGANSRREVYVFNAFLRSRKAFAWSRKNYNTVLTLNFHIFHRTDYDGFLADFPVKTNLDWTAFKKNWLPRLQLA